MKKAIYILSLGLILTSCQENKPTVDQDLQELEEASQRRKDSINLHYETEKSKADSAAHPVK